MGTAILLCIGVLTFLLAIRPELRGGAAAKQKAPVNWNPTQNVPTQIPSVVPETSVRSDEATQGGEARGKNASAAVAAMPSNVTSKPAPAAARTHPVVDLNTPPNSQPEQSVPEGGAAELAVARDYLSGKNGPPNGQAAAQMLWKAIAKKNSTALLLLSDLYANGNGVGKNCDQARLLLDAALQKNVPAADYKLKILQQTCR
jgi:hypothetical protein